MPKYVTCSRCEDLTTELLETKKELRKLKDLVNDLANATALRATIDAGEMSKGDMSKAQYSFLHGRLGQCNTTLATLGRETIDDPTRQAKSESALFSGLFR